MSMEREEEPAARPKLRTWIWNPFHYLAGGPALGIGLAVMFVSALVCMATQSHFDGLLDFHTGAAVPWWLYLLEGPVAWFTFSILVTLGGMLISKSRFRILDVFGTQALARSPALITALTQLPPPVRRANEHIMQVVMAGPPAGMVDPKRQLSSLMSMVTPVDMAVLAALSLVLLVMIVWMVALMYRAFAVSCNVSGGKAIGMFFVLVILGEFVSKLCLGAVYWAAGL